MKFTKKFQCRVCSRETRCKHVISVKSELHDIPNDRDVNYEFARCDKCKSLTLLDLSDLIGYSEMEEVGYWRYTEIGAGIDSMGALIESLFQTIAVEKPKFLDIGCGFGFLVDYAKFLGAEVAIGVEDADYGKIGSRVLGFELKSEADSLEYKFDIITASEVIEHVESPLDFLKAITANLSGSGVLVLTTPNSEFLENSAQGPFSSMQLAALSPGYHTCLLSKGALESLLEQIGLTHKMSVIQNERLITYASRQPLPIGLEFKRPESYQDYLKRLVEIDDEHVSIGAKYRLFKEYVNAGIVSNDVLSLRD